MSSEAEQLARREVVETVQRYMSVTGPRKTAQLLAAINRYLDPPRRRGREKGETKYDPMALIEKMLEVDLTDPKRAGRALTALATKLHSETPQQFGASVVGIRKRMARLRPLAADIQRPDRDKWNTLFDPKYLPGHEPGASATDT
jgi:hypothetical protein